MKNWTRLGLLIGALALALSMFGIAFADAPTVYFDTHGVVQGGDNPFPRGWYDALGAWHTDAGLAFGTTTEAMVKFATPDIYNPRHYNYYAGYGARYELDRGYTYTIGPYGQFNRIDLTVNRTLVKLTADNNFSHEVELDRGFERGLVEAAWASFDPMRLEIPTGRMVTFYADRGTHMLVALEEATSITQRVTIAPNQVFTWTFTQPGVYRMEDWFGGGPTGDRMHGLIIHVTGEPVAWNDSAFADVEYIHTTAVAAVKYTPFVPVVVDPHSFLTAGPTVEVQGEKFPAPVKKVHKTVPRNHEQK